MRNIIIHKSSTLFQISLPFTKMAWIYKISGKEEVSTFVTLAGIVIILFSVVGMVSDLFSTVKSLFSFN